MMHLESLLAQGGSRWDTRTGSISMPIHQTTTFRHPALGASTGFDYSRTSNPTRSELESVIAAMEGGTQALAFSSGMACIDCVLRLFQPGDKLLVLEDLYGGTWRMLETVFKPWGLKVHYVSYQRLQECAIEEFGSFQGVFLETPTNPTLNVVDIEKFSQVAHAMNAIVIVDNTFLTAYSQRPFELGADVVVYSASKYLGGHNDVLAGIAVSNSEAIDAKLSFLQNTTGAILSPWDSWLLLRGLKTLPLRLKQQQANALAIAQYLEQHPKVARVYYPGLASHPDYAIQMRQATGGGAMVAFELKDAERVPQVIANVQLWIFAESLGGVESLITLPSRQTHADVPVETRYRLGISDELLRLSVGIEHVDDLINDLAQAIGD
jgi:cystathionine gamma-synthase